MADESVCNGIFTESFDSQESMKMNEKKAMVEEMLSNVAFREELMSVVAEKVLMCTTDLNQLASAQPLTELLTLRQRFSVVDCFSLGDDCTVPICDIRGVDSLNYSKGEKLFRCKLASFCRLIDLFGWSNTAQCYITARLGAETDQYMAMPDGIWHDEVTATSLVKINSGGEVLDAGSTGLGIDLLPFSVHSKIYSIRTDVGCVIELTCPPALSLSAMKCGLLPLCPEAMLLDEVIYLDLSDFLSTDEKLVELAEKPNSKVLVLRNFGVIIVAETIEEAFYLTYNLIAAIDTQLSLVPIGLDNLHIPSEEFSQKVLEFACQQPMTGNKERSSWGCGELEFEAMMRQLDSAGYFTGYAYHDAMSQSGTRQHRAASDVGLAQSGISLVSFGGSDRELSKFASPQRIVAKGVKPDWMLTPNVYNREEHNSKSVPNTKITKWLLESVPGRSSTTPTKTDKMDKANQFAPQGINPAELKEKVKAIRRDYYSDRVSAGPQSRILDGITWDEAKLVKDGHVSGSADSLVTMTASKGIIQREHQRHAVGFKKFDAPNPFNRMSEEEIEIYKQEVERRTMTGSFERLTRDGIDPGPDGRLISSEERMKRVRQGEVTQKDMNDQGEI